MFKNQKESDHNNHTYDTKVHQIDYHHIKNIDSLAKQMSSTGVFGAGRLGKAIDLLEMAENNGAHIFVGLAGAMVPGGMRNIISQAIRDERIHCLTTTGANITHDLIEAFGGNHIQNVFYKSDLELREKGIDRIYDAFVSPGSFEIFEDKIKEFLNKLWDEKSIDGQLIISPAAFLQEIGSIIKDPDSIVKAAYDMKVPIFVPAISDSVLGLQIWLFSQFNRLIIDSIKDLEAIQEKFHESKSTCAFLLGGGVPKNFTLQAALMASKHYDCAIQITMDRVETGGLSGASLSEAISWGKIEPDAYRATVISDLTIALPIIYATLQYRAEMKKRN